MSNLDMNSEEVLMMAESCARQIAKLFNGDIEAAIKMVEEDHQAITEIALNMHMNIQRKLTTSALTKPDFPAVMWEFAKQHLAK